MPTEVGAAQAGRGVRSAAEPYPWERELGARPLADGRCQFRVWAPRASESVAVRLASGDVALEEGGYGVYEGTAPCGAGEDYWIVLDGQPLPDPCTRWQPEGLRGPSRVLDPGGWVGAGPAFVAPPLRELVLYELHVGTFTPEGTFEAAIPHLSELAALGVGAIEIMPVAEFPGARGWGYDGVYLSAAQSSYGGPEGLARLVHAAHQCGLAVILDVVYNHLGASGVQAIEAFGPYFTEKYETPWGRAINYDDADCDPVRESVLQSAAGWIRDFGIDGLRLDAIHAIFDSSPEHIVAAISRRVHLMSEGSFVIAESGLNDPRMMRPRERGGYGCDAEWADDFHHALRVLLTGYREGYYEEFGHVAQLAKAYHRPHVHDGDYSTFRRRRFGAPADDIGPDQFVVFAQNHDQVGNRAYGDRLPAPARPLAAFCVLLAPFVPLLFMGEEFGEEAPFQFFSDHIDEAIATATREGRRREFASFAQFGHEIPDPQAASTFEASKLTRKSVPALARLYRDLIAVRRELPPGDADEIAFDEQARWLLVRRGEFELVCNFASEGAQVPCSGARVVLATGGEPVVQDGHVELAALSGALVGSG
ncbi:MAG TPA: malto-oligosyltrehalose trehalohydrolase [Solirubrobacteraceae bacterium]|nr:malto-oligosyltrehalose trehalohydrolase [Solirubrobacteraceae bacterium]